jgi:hypothetical protein
MFQLLFLHVWQQMLYEIYHVASFSMLQLFYLMSQQPYLHVVYVFQCIFILRTYTACLNVNNVASA